MKVCVEVCLFLIYHQYLSQSEQMIDERYPARYCVYTCVHCISIEIKVIFICNIFFSYLVFNSGQLLVICYHSRKDIQY